MGLVAFRQIHNVNKKNIMANEINVPIKGEADASELRRVIYAMAAQNPDSFVAPKEIKAVLDLLPKAIGYCMRHSAPLENDSYRFEIDNGLIIHAVPTEGHEGVAFGHPYKVEDHFEIHVKFHGKALDAISEQLGLEAKNG